MNLIFKWQFRSIMILLLIGSLLTTPSSLSGATSGSASSFDSSAINFFNLAAHNDTRVYSALRGGQGGSIPAKSRNVASRNALLASAMESLDAKNLQFVVNAGDETGDPGLELYAINDAKRYATLNLTVAKLVAKSSSIKALANAAASFDQKIVLPLEQAALFHMASSMGLFAKELLVAAQPGAPEDIVGDALFIASHDDLNVSADQSHLSDSQSQLSADQSFCNQYGYCDPIPSDQAFVASWQSVLSTDQAAAAQAHQYASWATAALDAEQSNYTLAVGPACPPGTGLIILAGCVIKTASAVLQGMYDDEQMTLNVVGAYPYDTPISSDCGVLGGLTCAAAASAIQATMSVTGAAEGTVNNLSKNSASVGPSCGCYSDALAAVADFDNALLDYQNVDATVFIRVPPQAQIL
jgi:hypothetical protein